jgi:UDP-N-acetylmuramoylalanine--D-glutamate ligase
MTADDFLVVNWSQDKLRDLASRTSATVVPFSSSEKVDGAYLADGNLYFKDELIMPASDMMLPGLHNIENALAAIAVAKLSGAENAPLADVLRTFSGVKHRMQYLGAIDGVKFYNDSKATNIKATQKALGAFEPAKTVLIAGGLDRGNGFDELSDFVKDLKGMIVFGQTADKLKALAEGLDVHVVKVDDVQTAAKFAFDHAAPGDVVLLSPANASWDQFKSFELRGDAFIAAFQELEKSAK